MATIRTKPLDGKGFDVFSDLRVTDLEDYDRQSISSSMARFYDDARNGVTFSGSGFKYKMSNGALTDVTAGKITKIQIKIDGVDQAAITGIKLSAAKVFDFFVQDDPAGGLYYLLDGNDTISGTRLADFLRGYDGNDVLSGGLGADKLYGNDGRDVLKGDGGSDIVNGGQGNDVLYGGNGADTFQFDQVSGASLGIDVIADFRHGQGDKISLGLVDADVFSSGKNEFTFIGAAGFSGDTGELRAYRNGAYTNVEGDTNGDGVRDFVIRVKGAPTLGADDFLF